MLEAVAAYGRVYKDPDSVLVDWNNDKDFLVVRPYGSGYINKSDAKQHGVPAIRIYFGKSGQENTILIPV